MRRCRRKRLQSDSDPSLSTVALFSVLFFQFDAAIVGTVRDVQVFLSIYMEDQMISTSLTGSVLMSLFMRSTPASSITS
jgi:hypothetical protein